MADIIISSTPRFSVGIFGGWGTGKTSLMLMIKEILDSHYKVVTVWFDAWRYEREENLAVIPFLRTVKLTLDASEKTKEGKWEAVKNGVKRSAIAILTSTKVTYGMKDVASAETDFGKVADALRGDGSVGNDANTIYYYGTQFLEKALVDLRSKDTDKDYRIVVFIDDLDRCSPERALEVLESIKSFFDIEGIVYVVGMDSRTINSIVRKKFGEDYAAKGNDYLQKIVQLPFQIPTWKEVDISGSISKIIKKGLEGSELVDEFEKYKPLIVKAIELNPREVKRFINTVILVKSVFGKPIDELIAVHALNFRHDWNRFLELITIDDNRQIFARLYRAAKHKGITVNIEEDLDKLSKESVEAIAEGTGIGPVDWKGALEIYRELLKRGNALTSFLDAGALEILGRIGHMEEHRRVLATGTVKSIMTEQEKKRFERKIRRARAVTWVEYVDLLKAGMIQVFNRERPKFSFNFNGIDLSEFNLEGVDLHDVRLSKANLSSANLSGANLERTDLDGANLSGANLSYIREYSGLRCEEADFKNAIITNAKFTKYLHSHGAINVPEVRLVQRRSSS